MEKDKKSTVTINDETSKVEGTVLGTVTSDELGVTAETAKSTVNNEADSVLNALDTIQENNVEDMPTPAPKPAKAPANTPKETNDVEPWGDEAPTTEDDLINELFYYSGMAKDVAKDMIEKLKAAKDAKLKADMINHIAWHIGTGGPKNKTNGGKGKALHKKDILDYLKTL